MHCLRCGTEIDSPNTFCESCLEFMKDSPVSRETPVVLLPHPEYEPMKPRPVKPEELLAQSEKNLRRSKKVILWLILICLALVVILALVVRHNRQLPAKGQNYTTVSAEASTTTEPQKMN